MANTLFTSRLGGVSSPPFDSFNLASHVGDEVVAVAKNREILASMIGLPRNQIFFMTQVHSNGVAVIDKDSDPQSAPTADALFTTTPGFALVTLIADCTPLLLKSKSAVAAVHVGRKGLVAEVFEATLKVFNQHGVSNQEITGEIGPSICRDCYEVDLGTYREVVSLNPAAATDESRRCLDVAGGLAARLKSAGIEFWASQLCVRHTPGYFSYRRDEVTGRQAGVVWL
ncbi:MAG: peptidoglycan editing factor PgeF [Candidatus Nanopelagicaceae bacterium]|nr:peptidoglycan editing factor PgeF [Candidatus Nanopelagicaceae bacterium]